VSTSQPPQNPQNPWGAAPSGVPPPPLRGQPPRRGISPWIWALLGCFGMFFLFIPITAAILFPVFAQAREKARQIACLSNLKQQGLAILMYSEDYDGRLPAADRWMDLAGPYTKDATAFRCPSVSTSDPSAFGYAYNDKLSKAKIEKIGDPQTVALTYDSESTGRNAHDAMTSLPPKGRHRGGNNIAYADGHAKYNAKPVAIVHY